MTDYEIGDWIKVTDEEDYYNIKSIDLDSGYVEVQDVSGHTWYTAVKTIERKCSNKEIYGVTEKTTADEFNEREDVALGTSIVKSNEEVSGVFMSNGKVKHVDYVKEEK